MLAVGILVASWALYALATDWTSHSPPHLNPGTVLIFLMFLVVSLLGIRQIRHARQCERELEEARKSIVVSDPDISA